MAAITKSKNYDNCRFHLQRKFGLKISGKLTHFFIEKFTNSKFPTRGVKILVQDLIDAKIIPKKGKKLNEGQYATIRAFREDMCSKYILICQADKEELNQEEANSKAAIYQYGASIKKYIEIALKEKSSFFERLDTKANDERVDELEKKLNKLIAFIMLKNPPDTNNRRVIAKNFYDDPEKMQKLLDKELEEVKKLAHNHLQLVENGDLNDPF